MTGQVETIDVFSTPVWSSKLEDFKTHKRRMIKFAEAIRRKDPVGVHKSNVSGYQSADVSWSEELKPVYSHVLEVMVRQAIQDCELSITGAAIPNAWINFNDRLNCFNSPHLHQGVFSGIFYLNAPPGSGELVIENSGHNSLWEGDSFRNKSVPTKYNAPNCIVHPQEGSILIWCAHLTHFVRPNSKDVNRISVSFNIHCEFNPPQEN